MSVDEARRLLLHDAARTAWGAEAALVLMEMLPPTGWGDVATRRQLDALETRLDQKFDQLEERSDQKLDHLKESFELRLDARIADAQRRTIQWNVGTMIALTGVVAAVARLV